MSNILKRPGWASLLSEKIKIGDKETVIPGWGPGKEAKKFFQGKIGEEVPTGKYGSNRKVGGTSYREAELAFARWCAKSLQMREDVIATKQVKELLAMITPELLEQRGFSDVDEWIEGWKIFANDTFGLDLSNVKSKKGADVKAAVDDITDEINDAPLDDEPLDGEPIEDEPAAPAPAAPAPQVSPEFVAQLKAKPVSPQIAEPNEDNTGWVKVSYMKQDGGKITYVYLKNVPKNPQTIAALRQAKTVGDIVDSEALKPYLQNVEVAEGNNSKFYTAEQLAAAEPAPEEPAAPVGESKLSLRQQNILTESMRVKRMQHYQYVNEYFTRRR